MTEPKKFDHGKPRTDLLPSGAMLAMAQGLAYGAAKYGDYNYMADPFDDTYDRRLYGACLRHLFAWAGGEDFDRESGLTHLSHAGCNLLMLMHRAEARQEGEE